ncbi:MAG: hypothetical protein A3F78_02480 [Burkholderiales bacterium RIFCSPLOWO2_12_FULL_61_40]|nr:MAG: hypothetical protein A3F78_02480 [Burkholderiales bacterium RIFCSPLOWO2_12_FULL_61_40]
MSTSFFPAALAACALASLAACGGGGTSSTTSTLSGTAATGAPITNATVAVQCQSGSPATTTTHATDGSWQVTLGTNTQLPCALQVSGGSLPSGTRYHSLALAAGTANITPWTDLVLANAAQQDPATWYASAQLASNLQALSETALNAALVRVNTQLGVSGTMVDSRSPFTSSFQANGTDKLDKVLDAIKAAMSSAGATHASLLAEAAKGSTFTAPSAFSSALGTQLATLSSGSGSTTGSTGGTGTCTTPSVSLAYSGNTGGPVAHGASLCFTTVSTSTLAFGTTTLTSPTNTGGSAPYAFWVFTDPATSLQYEVIFNGSALHEINLTGPASSGSHFLGQFAAASSSSGSGNGTGSGTAATGVTLPTGSTVSASVVATYQALINGAGNKIITHADASSGATVTVYDYINYISVGAGQSGFSAKIDCALNSQASDYYPLCADKGVQFDRSAGTLSLSEVTMTPVVQMTYSCATTGACRIHGSLSFTPY